MDTSPQHPPSGGDSACPLVSVVIPSFNRAYCLPRAVDSVLNQTYRRVEAIIVDDGSSDDTRDVVMSRYADDPRVRYVHQENTGVSGARNHGMQLAQGEFIALLDSDDVWFPWKLSAQLVVLRAFPEAGMVWSDMQAIAPDGRVTHARYLKRMYSAYRWFDQRSLFDRSLRLADIDQELPDDARSGESFCGDLYSPMIMGNLVHTSTVVLRRERMLRVGDFSSKYKQGGEDYHFHLRTCREGPVAFLDVPTIQYQLGLADQITRPGSQIHFARSFLEIVETEISEHRDQIRLPNEMLRNVLAEAHGWLSAVALDQHDHRMARRQSWLSLRQALWQPAIWKVLCLSLIPSPICRLLRSVIRPIRSLFRPSTAEHAHA